MLVFLRMGEEVISRGISKSQVKMLEESACDTRRVHNLITANIAFAINGLCIIYAEINCRTTTRSDKKMKWLDTFMRTREKRDYWRIRHFLQFIAIF